MRWGSCRYEGLLIACGDEGGLIRDEGGLIGDEGGLIGDEGFLIRWVFVCKNTAFGGAPNMREASSGMRGASSGMRV